MLGLSSHIQDLLDENPSAHKLEQKEIDTLETKQLYHLIDILKNQSIKGNIITGDLFFNVTKIDQIADESFFNFYKKNKKGDN